MNPRAFRLWCVLLVALATLLPLDTGVVAAETLQQTEPPQTDQIYIVQQGDTLYGIAQSFGIPMELLVAANNIQDPTMISPGQQLIIPLADPQTAAIHSHIVETGDTLRSVALRYQTAEREIAIRNHLVRGDRLYIGETLAVAGAEASEWPLGHTIVVEPDDTLIGIAAENVTSPWELVLSNNLRTPFASWPTDRLWVPDPTHNSEFFDGPALFQGLNIHPLPAIQGQSLSIGITSTSSLSVTGHLDENPLSFRADVNGTFALFGLGALMPPGIMELTLFSSDPGDGIESMTRFIPVGSGGFESEQISVVEEIAVQMTDQVVQEEAALIDEIFSTASAVRLWDGLFALPSNGDLTSLFGIRREYNVPSATAYHSGTDLGAPIGAPALAPAAGEVVFARTLTVRGNTVIIDHGWGVMSGFWHLSEISVQPGDQVELGDQIGNVGNSGLSTGPHLHWEMRVGGVPVDGLQWLTEQYP